MVGSVDAVCAGVLGNVAGPECMHACMDGLRDGMWEFGGVCGYIVLCCLMSIWLAFGRIGWMDGWMHTRLARDYEVVLLALLVSPLIACPSHDLW